MKKSLIMLPALFLALVATSGCQGATDPGTTSNPPSTTSTTTSDSGASSETSTTSTTSEDTSTTSETTTQETTSEESSSEESTTSEESSSEETTTESSSEESSSESSSSEEEKHYVVNIGVGSNAKHYVLSLNALQTSYEEYFVNNIDVKKDDIVSFTYGEDALTVEYEGMSENNLNENMKVINDATDVSLYLKLNKDNDGKNYAWLGGYVAPVVETGYYLAFEKNNWSVSDEYKLAEVDKDQYLHQWKIEHHFDKYEEFKLRDAKTEGTAWFGYSKVDPDSVNVTEGSMDNFRAEVKGTYTIYLKEVTEGNFSVYIGCVEDEIIYTAQFGYNDLVTLTWSADDNAYKGTLIGYSMNTLFIYADGEAVNYVAEDVANNNIDADHVIKTPGTVDVYYHKDNTVFVSGYVEPEPVYKVTIGSEWETTLSEGYFPSTYGYGFVSGKRGDEVRIYKNNVQLTNLTLKEDTEYTVESYRNNLVMDDGKMYLRNDILPGLSCPLTLDLSDNTLHVQGYFNYAVSIGEQYAPMYYSARDNAYRALYDVHVSDKTEGDYDTTLRISHYTGSSLLLKVDSAENNNLQANFEIKKGGNNIMVFYHPEDGNTWVSGYHTYTVAFNYDYRVMNESSEPLPSGVSAQYEALLEREYASYNQFFFSYEGNAISENIAATDAIGNNAIYKDGGFFGFRVNVENEKVFLKVLSGGGYEVFMGGMSNHDAKVKIIVNEGKEGEAEYVASNWNADHNAYTKTLEVATGDTISLTIGGFPYGYVTAENVASNNLDQEFKIKQGGEVTVYVHDDYSIYVSGYQVQDREIIVTDLPESFVEGRTYCVWAYGGSKADAFYAATLVNNTISAHIPEDSTHFIVVMLKNGETEFIWENKDVQSRSIPLEDGVSSYTYNEPVPPLPEGYVLFTINDLPDWWQNDCQQVAYIESTSKGALWVNVIVNGTTAIVQAPEDTTKIVLVRMEKGATPSWDDMTKVYNQSGDILTSEGVTTYSFVEKA